MLYSRRLNWQLHFGEPPKWSRDVRFILLDIDPTQRDAGRAEMMLMGDVAAVCGQVSKFLSPPRRQGCQAPQHGWHHQTHDGHSISTPATVLHGCADVATLHNLHALWHNAEHAARCGSEACGWLHAGAVQVLFGA